MSVRHLDSIFLYLSDLQAVPLALSQLSLSTISSSYLLRQTEPEMLRLVLYFINIFFVKVVGAVHAPAVA